MEKQKIPEKKTRYADKKRQLSKMYIIIVDMLFRKKSIYIFSTITE